MLSGIKEKPMKTALERSSTRGLYYLALAGVTILIFNSRTAQGQGPGSFTKAVVADHIRKVEDGVDEFRKYLEKRGEDAQNRSQTAQSSGTKTRRGRGASEGNTEARKEQARRT